MIPIRDTVQSRSFPVVNSAIIAVNVLIFLFQLTRENSLIFLLTYGLVPIRYTSPEAAAYFTTGQQVFSFVSFMFLHGGFLHLLGNMWSLYIFGDNVEDHLGPFRYLLFYLFCGMASGASHLLLNPQSDLPTIGASGAIAGVMGAYFLLYPRAKILTLIPIIIIPWFIEIPAYFFLGLWFVLQLFNAAGSLGGAAGIAWWAHIGGFICGILFLKAMTLFPVLGISDRVRQVTKKKRTHRLQVIRPIDSGNDPHLYGTLYISPYESLAGAAKLVNIPWNYKKRMVRVKIPPGMKTGHKLRLKGLGKPDAQEGPGDLYLKVIVK
jgi:membrane associated rhomboid family serine protease